MKQITDCNGIPYPIFTTGTVASCESVSGAKPEGSVFCLKINTIGENARMPLPGQFFMLRSEKSQQLLARPISVFHAEKTSCGAQISFLIIFKGKGTKELCSLLTQMKKSKFSVRLETFSRALQLHTTKNPPKKF